MPVIYAYTKKAKLEAWLKRQETWMTKSEIKKKFSDETSIEISLASVSAALKEWQMNNYVTQQGKRFLWTWTRKQKA